MSILRYTASADTTISNAYKSNLYEGTRATGSNMGMADSLEVFSIYGQTTSSAAGYSQELSRILMKFPVATISSDRTAKTIPASGSVSFYLRMFNVEHPFTLPSNYYLTVAGITSDWEEGIGLDMEAYSDKDEANWINRTGTKVAASTKLTIQAAFLVNVGDTMTLKGLKADGTTQDVVLTAHGSITDDDNDSNTPRFKIAAYNAGGGDLPNRIAGALNANQYFTANASGNEITVTQVSKGVAGNTAVTHGNIAAADIVVSNSNAFAGGLDATPWTVIGGDFHTGTYDPDDNLPHYNVHIKANEGHKDLELDITSLVEEWIASNEAATANNGLGIFLSASYEAYHSNSSGAHTAGSLHNLAGIKKSYYTKKFSGRGTEYFFKRPVIEARWNSANKDDSGNFYLSSSILPAADNLNTLYLYNYYGGHLRDLPAGTVKFKLYSGSSGLSGAALKFPAGGDASANASEITITNPPASTGIYPVSFAYVSSSITKVFPVWLLGSAGIHTGSAITVKTHNASNYNPSPGYITNIKNVKAAYSRNETARFRVTTRQKDWNPTIYTVASSSPEIQIIESASFKVLRLVDNLEVISFGTGSTLHTQLSYDVSGSYFDLDMFMFEAGYMYGIQLAYYINQDWVEQEEIFKFRVE